MNIEINLNIRLSSGLEAAIMALAGVVEAKDQPAPGAAHAPTPKPGYETTTERAAAVEAVASEAVKNKGGRPKKDAPAADPTPPSDAPAVEEAPSSSEQTDVVVSSAPEGSVTKAMCQDAMGTFLAKEGNSGLGARQIIIDNADGATSLSNADPKFYPVIFEKLGGVLRAAN